MSVKKTIILLGILGLLLFAGCASNNGTNNQTTPTTNQIQKINLMVAGSTTVQPIAAKAAEIFNQQSQNTAVSVQGGGSGAGIKMVSEGSADIGTSSRDLTADELNSGLKPYDIAADGIAIIVNPSNSINDLTKQQVQDIFSGKIKNFKEVGGPDKEIVVIIREQGSGTRSSFEELVMKKGAVNNSESSEQQPSNGAVKASLMSNPYAIGYVSAGFVDSSIKAVTVGGIAPTQENIKSTKYPISRKLYMVTKGEATGAKKEFIDFVLSPKGQQIVEDEGYVKL